MWHDNRVLAVWRGVLYLVISWETEGGRRGWWIAGGCCWGGVVWCCWPHHPMCFFSALHGDAKNKALNGHSPFHCLHPGLEGWRFTLWLAYPIPSHPTPHPESQGGQGAVTLTPPSLPTLIPNPFYSFPFKSPPHLSGWCAPGNVGGGSLSHTSGCTSRWDGPSSPPLPQSPLLPLPDVWQYLSL